MSSLPSGVRLVRLLNEHLSDIMNRERTNTAPSTCIARVPTGSLSSVRPISYALRFRIARPLRCACSGILPGRDGVRHGSFAPLVCPQAYLEKRRVGLQVIDRPRTSLGGLPCVAHQ